VKKPDNSGVFDGYLSNLRRDLVPLTLPLLRIGFLLVASAFTQFFDKQKNRELKKVLGFLSVTRPRVAVAEDHVVNICFHIIHLALICAVCSIVSLYVRSAKNMTVNFSKLC
ncbi:MAG: hypothetical protein MSM72_08105, partial [Firmicutes bacterium]|nr:hypothetical protein [Bacillota bacterium]